MSEPRRGDGGREFVWFAVLLLAVLAVAAGAPRGPSTASEMPSAAAP